MSARIAPLPDGMGVASIADKQPRRQRSGATRISARATAAKATEPNGLLPEQPAFTPASDESLPPGTLFTAAVLSSGIAPGEATLAELRIRRNRGWSPPESILRLRDKTI